MKNLLQLIQDEGNRNNTLKNVLDEGKFPSEEVAKQIGSEELYKIATNTVEFNFRTNIEILKSSFYLVALVDQYIREFETSGQVPEVDLYSMRKLKEEYTKESRNITNSLVKQFMHGYEASW